MIIDYFNIHKSPNLYLLTFVLLVIIISILILNAIRQRKLIRKFRQAVKKAINRQCRYSRAPTAKARARLSLKATLTKNKSSVIVSKIEQLKTKHDHAQAQIKHCYIELAEHKQLIEDQHKTIQLLEERLAHAQQKRNHLENNLIRAVELEREKQKGKISQLTAEIQRLKQETKGKDYAIFQMENEIQRKAKQFKELLQQQRKKTLVDYEQKINSILSEKNALEQENQELKQLVTRQHKALQLQNEQYQQCNKRNEELTEMISSLEDQLEQAARLRLESEEQIAEMANLIEKMDGELLQFKSGQNAKDQVEELRKKVNQLAKGEIERIQLIVNEFE